MIKYTLKWGNSVFELTSLAIGKTLIIGKTKKLDKKLTLWLDTFKHDDNPTTAPIPKNPTKEVIKLARSEGIGSYSKLYRGLVIPNITGKTFKHKRNVPSLWTQDFEWAKAFADWDPNGFVIEMPFKNSLILADLNKLPYELGPAGREPELLVKAGTYICKVIWRKKV